MHLRQSAVFELLRTSSASFSETPPHIDLAARFGHLTFNRSVMERMLSKEVTKGLFAAMEGREKLNPQHCDALASSLKDWAVHLGATHFCHWFQPLTGVIAEKQDSFLDFGPKGMLMEKLSGKQLLRGEPDASSFPSGGLRNTFSARGYTCWDPGSVPFIWKTAGQSILCIPSVFFSWSGEALDMKIPLIRSEEKLNQASVRLLRLLEMDTGAAYSTLGCEQEFFIVDRRLCLLRPDLLLSGRSVFGSPCPKTQEFGAHYFSSMPERVLYLIREVEEAAACMGIPLKTRHSEVAPHQYEIAPLFEKSSQAIDHNLLLMQLMQRKAEKHGLVCLFHEKPFKGINGSGKHCNWSLSTDGGINLLDPALLQDKPLVFLSFLTAVLSGVHRHSSSLTAAVASSGNDLRLGGHEAPPSIFSVYLGGELERLLEAVENEKEYAYFAEGKCNVRIPALPDLMLDTMDRNRTAPFAFTGNKFEFRSVGASAHCGEPITVLNAVVAESLRRMADETEALLNQKIPLKQAVLQVVQKELAYSRPIRYLGNNYTSEWREEAEKRGLFIGGKAVRSFELLKGHQADLVFEGILSREERTARVDVLEDRYAKTIELEAGIMIELFDTQILPACFESQKIWAENVVLLQQADAGRIEEPKALLSDFGRKTAEAVEAAKRLRLELSSALLLESKARAFAFCDCVSPRMDELRVCVDELEKCVQDEKWPLPKYRELLFLL